MLDIKWSSPYKIKVGAATKWQRDWNIPSDMLTGFFEFWKKNRFSLLADGFTVKKSEVTNKWFLYETKDDIALFKSFSNDASKPTTPDDNFVLPPYEVKNKSGLRPWQVDAAGKLIASIKHWGAGVDGSEMGIGKCHPKGTLIRMFDGSLKKVEDILMGDQLMGDDSTPRNVMSLAQGTGDLFNIHPYRGGEVFGVNGEHILVLINTSTKEIREISVREYIFRCTSSTRFHSEWKLFRTSVEYPTKEVPVNPYFLGLWLGDGTWCRAEITVADIDTEIAHFLNEYAMSEGLRLVIGNPRVKNGIISKCKPYNLRGTENKKNPLLDTMRSLGLTLTNIKFIPKLYLYNSREIRLNVLAGIIDSDGSAYHSGCYEVSCKNESFKEEVVELARSLGYCVNPIKVNKTWTYKGQKKIGQYWRINISGAHDVPCKLKRKFSKPRLQPKDVLHTSFGVEPIGMGTYYGFTLDKNSRYLMKDFTVTHNTFTSCGVVKELNVPFVIVCPKPVMSQWIKVVNSHFKLTDTFKGIINYELLIRGRSDSPIASFVLDRKTKRKKFVWKLPKNAVIIWDEAHRLKNWKTKISKVCIEAHKQKFKQLFLSATLASSPLDLRTVGTCTGIFKNAGGYYTWIKDHGVYQGNWGLEFNNDPITLKKLHHVIFGQRGVRLQRDIIPNFPETEIIVNAYDMAEEDASKIRAIYDDMKNELKVLKLKEKSDASEMAIRIRALQKTELLKVPLMEEMIRDALSTGMSVVVFLNYSDSIDALASRMNTNCIYDGRNQKDRQNNITLFQENKEPLLITNISAAREGLDLQDFNGNHPRLTIISPCDSIVKMKQCLGRVHRESSKSKSIQKFIYVANTQEEYVVDNIGQKLENLTLINNGEITDNDLKICP